MIISKNTQKLMPYGTEIILQAGSTSGQKIKVSICKRFDSNLEAQTWHKAKKDAIRAALVTLEMICNKK